MDNCNLIIEIMEKIKAIDTSPLKIMEVCGSHTEVIGRLGLRDILYPKVNLVSGPGCPVCVTDESYIDAALKLLNRENILITTLVI